MGGLKPNGFYFEAHLFSQCTRNAVMQGDAITTEPSSRRVATLTGQKLSARALNRDKLSQLKYYVKEPPLDWSYKVNGVVVTLLRLQGTKLQLASHGPCRLLASFFTRPPPPTPK